MNISQAMFQEWLLKNVIKLSVSKYLLESINKLMTELVSQPLNLEVQILPASPCTHFILLS